MANIDGRACAVSAEGGVDIEEGSDGRFSSRVDDVVAVLRDVAAWSATAELDPALSTAALADDLGRLGSPVTNPSQVFAIGLNYRSHAKESGMELPEHPMIFTKFASSICGPGAQVTLPADTVDWEVELVVVIGHGGRHISVSDALDHVAGFAVGQDLSDRALQLANRPPQFSLGKSHENFSPIGPWLTTLDEIAEPLDLALSCSVGDETLQSARTSGMIFDVPAQIAYLSTICELRAGDVVFTGTPDGVGMGRTPPRYLEPGMELVSSIDGLGELRNTFA